MAKTEHPYCRHMTVLNEKQLEGVATRQLEFLKLIHPQLNNTDWSEGAIEIRPIKRDQDDKTYVRSYNTFCATDKDKEHLVDFLKKVNGRGFCLYFSIYTFDPKKECIKADGKKFTKGKINNENSLFTTTLMADFDDISKDDFLKFVERFKSVGLYPILVFTGHGFQAHILLKEKIYNKHILKHYNELLLSKGFKVDTKIQDSARQARLVEWWNCKELDVNYEHYNPIDPELPATLQLDTDYEPQRYSLVEVFQKLRQLETVIPQEEDEIVTDSILEQIETKDLGELVESKGEIKRKRKIDVIEIESYSNEYEQFFDFDSLPHPIQRMFIQTPQGVRNDALLFLIPLLKNTMGLSLKEIRDCMVIWGANCEPPLSKDFVVNEVNRLYAYRYDGRWGKYTSELAKEFGAFDFELLELRNDDSIKIPNKVIEALADKPFNEGVLRTYLLILLHLHEEDEVERVTIEDIIKITESSRKTIDRHLNELIARKFIIRRTEGVYRKGKEGYTYYPNPILFFSSDGFKLITATLIESMYDNLKDGEAMLYLYMKTLTISSGKKKVLTSQKKLGENICRSQQRVSEITKSLEVKRFLTKETTGEAFFMRTTYKLKK